jgi:hypothetical protein
MPEVMSEVKAEENLRAKRRLKAMQVLDEDEPLEKKYKDGGEGGNETESDSEQDEQDEKDNKETWLPTLNPDIFV